MGKTIYNTCVELLKDKKGKIITQENLKGLIIKNIGGQQRTIDRALQVMVTTGLIKDVGNWRFKIIGSD